MVRGAKRQGGSKLFNTEGAQPAPGTSRSDCPFFWDWNRPVQGLELTGWPEFAFGPAVRVNVTAAANRDNLPADPFTPLRPGSREDDAASLWPVEPPQAVLLLAAAQVLWAYLLACFACLSACLLACLLACLQAAVPRPPAGASSARRTPHRGFGILIFVCFFARDFLEEKGKRTIAALALVCPQPLVSCVRCCLCLFLFFRLAAVATARCLRFRVCWSPCRPNLPTIEPRRLSRPRPGSDDER